MIKTYILFEVLLLEIISNCSSQPRDHAATIPAGPAQARCIRSGVGSVRSAEDPTEGVPAAGEAVQIPEEVRSQAETASEADVAAADAECEMCCTRCSLGSFEQTTFAWAVATLGCA